MRWFLSYSPFCRFYDFLFGWLAAAAMKENLLQDGRISALAAGTLVVLTLRFLFHPNAFVMQSECAPLLMLILMVRWQDVATNKALSARWLVYIGEISYSLYLFQAFAIHMVGIGHERSFSWPLFGGFLALLSLSLILALSLATGLYRLVEMPSQRFLRRWIGPEPGERRASGGTDPGLLADEDRP